MELDALNFFRYKLLTKLSIDGWKDRNRTELEQLCEYADVLVEDALRMQPSYAKKVLERHFSGELKLERNSSDASENS